MKAGKVSLQSGHPALPLFVDLDGTLIHSDLLFESFIELVKRHPLDLVNIPLWLFRGKAYLKSEIASRAAIDAESLPYNRELLDFLHQEFKHGRPIYLATASNIRLATKVATNVGVFTDVLASDENINLSGRQKLEAIQRRAPEGFVYAANEEVDVPIWNASGAAITVNTSPGVAAKIEKGVGIEATFKRPGNTYLSLLKALRPYQWLKNLLVFLPLLPIVTSATAGMATAAMMAFIAFSFCASSVYVINDLSDLAADRAHPRKRRRPFASGSARLSHGLMLAPLLLFAAAIVGAFLPPRFFVVLAVYWLLTTAYTFVLKRYALIDVVTLAGLYTLRVIGGAAAIAVAPSFWILAFSMFIFFSLALAKRYTELHVMHLAQRDSAPGRGYQLSDLQSVQQMGITSGYLAVLVIALYINSSEIVLRYGSVELLWGICPLLMLWISRIWLKAGRGDMNDDPLIFAIKDRLSRLIGAAATLTVLAALLWR